MCIAETFKKLNYNRFLYIKKAKYVFGQLIMILYYKNTISLKLHFRTEKKRILIVEFNFFGGNNNTCVHFFLYKYC